MKHITEHMSVFGVKEGVRMCVCACVCWGARVLVYLPLGGRGVGGDKCRCSLWSLCSKL